MILVIDNYDSFTYNLVQYLGELGAELTVKRNDKVTLDQIEEMSPEKIVISPGPCTPREAGISNDVIETFGSRVPTLGVCLGHQCVGHVYGGKVVRAKRLMHGKTSEIHPVGNDRLFDGVERPFVATRYHSLIVQRESLPPCLRITAETDRKEIMAVKHKVHPVWGVQFHPESILTGAGKQILNNFLELCGRGGK